MKLNSHVPWHLLNDFETAPELFRPVWALVEHDAWEPDEPPLIVQLELQPGPGNPQYKWYIVERADRVDFGRDHLPQDLSVVAWRYTVEKEDGTLT